MNPLKIQLLAKNEQICNKFWSLRFYKKYVNSKILEYVFLFFWHRIRIKMFSQIKNVSVNFSNLACLGICHMHRFKILHLWIRYTLIWFRASIFLEPFFCSAYQRGDCGDFNAKIGQPNVITSEGGYRKDMLYEN